MLSGILKYKYVYSFFVIFDFIIDYEILLCFLKILEKFYELLKAYIIYHFIKICLWIQENVLISKILWMYETFVSFTHKRHSKESNTRETIIR